MRSFQFRLEKKPPVGLVHQVVEPDAAILLVRGGLTTEDGESLYQAVSSLTSDLIGKELLDRRMVLDEVACMVAVCDPDGLDIHVNPPVMLRVAAKKTVEKGEMALIDDLADIERMKFGPLDIPPDKGVIVLFRVGWRPVVYIDLVPSGPEGEPRDFDIEAELGALYARVQFREVFSANPEVTRLMAGDGWFPFTALLNTPFVKLYRAYEADKGTEGAVEEVLNHFDQGQLERMLDRWSKKKLLVPHIPILRRAVQKYEERDYVSAISVAQPRVTALLEEVLRLGPPKKGEKRKERLQRLLREKGRTGALLLTDSLCEYVAEYFWRSFDPEAEEVPFSRHSVAHGAAEEDSFTQVRALQTFLLIDHLFFSAPLEA